MARSIVDTLRHLEGGCLIDEASEKLAEVVRRVDATGKGGSCGAHRRATCSPRIRPSRSSN
jgi:hypothetical protein